MGFYDWEGGPRAVALPSTLASAGVSYPLPGSDMFRLVSVSFTLTCDANVGDRFAVVTLLAEGTTGGPSVAAPFKNTATNASAYTFGPDVSAFGADDAAHIGTSLPGGWLPENVTVKVTVDGAKAADTLTDVVLFVCQYRVTGDDT